MSDDASHSRTAAAASRFPGVDMLLRLRDRRPTPQDLDCIGKAVGDFMDHDGDLPLERCIPGMPPTPHKLRLHKRDIALRAAMRTMRETDPTAGPRELAAEWRRFRNRGRWDRLRHEPALPPHLPALDKALFEATTKNDGRTLSDKQLGRIVEDRRHDRRLDVSGRAVDSE